MFQHYLGGCRINSSEDPPKISPRLFLLAGSRKRRQVPASWFSASQTQEQDFVKSLIPPLSQPLNKLTSELLPCSREDPGMNTQPPHTLNSSCLRWWASSWPRKRHIMYLGEKHLSKLCTEEATQEEAASTIPSPPSAV